MTTVVNHIIYNAFGRVTSESNPAVDSLFLFTGRPFDSDTGLQNNVNRWYDPTVGRWLSEDPIGFYAGDGNLYRYVGNVALTGADPAGQQGWSKWLWRGMNAIYRGIQLVDAEEAEEKEARGPYRHHSGGEHTLQFRGAVTRTGEGTNFSPERMVEDFKAQQIYTGMQPLYLTPDSVLLALEIRVVQAKELLGVDFLGADRVVGHYTMIHKDLLSFDRFLQLEGFEFGDIFVRWICERDRSLTLSVADKSWQLSPSSQRGDQVYHLTIEFGAYVLPVATQFPGLQNWGALGKPSEVERQAFQVSICCQPY